MATSTSTLPQSRSTIISVPRSPERVRIETTATAPAQVDSFIASQPTDLGFLQQMRAQALALKADPQAVAVRGAEKSHAAATANWSSLMDATSGLSEQQQQAAGKHIFYNLASSSGQFTNADGSEMTAAQVRTHFGSLDETARETLNGQVREYGENNPEMMNMSIASGYADWSVEEVNDLAVRSQNGETIPTADLQRAQTVFQNGNGYVTNRGAYIGHIYDLHQMGAGKQAQEISQRLGG